MNKRDSKIEELKSVIRNKDAQIKKLKEELCGEQSKIMINTGERIRADKYRKDAERLNYIINKIIIASALKHIGFDLNEAYFESKGEEKQ